MGLSSLPLLILDVPAFTVQPWVALLTLLLEGTQRFSFFGSPLALIWAPAHGPWLAWLAAWPPTYLGCDVEALVACGCQEMHQPSRVRYTMRGMGITAHWGGSLSSGASGHWHPFRS